MKTWYQLPDNPWLAARRAQRRRFDRTVGMVALVAMLTQTAFAAQPLEDTTTSGGQGAVCPQGDVKYEVDQNQYEYTDNSASIDVFTEDGDGKNQATWEAADGSVINTVCIKIGGPGGGSLIWPNVDGGQGGPYAYDISHVVIASEDDDEDEPGLDFDKDVNKTTANPGESITYTLEYANTGEGNLTNVVITETYDTRFNFVSANPGPTSGENVWNFGLLAEGVSGEISITGTLDQDFPVGATIVHNVAVINSDQVGPLEKTADTEVIVDDEPDPEPEEDTGFLVVNKHFDDNGDGQVDRTNPEGWTWDLVGGSQNNIGGASLELPKGDYTIQEDTIDGYTSRWECSDKSDSTGVTAQVEVEEEETLTCTFINSKTPIVPPPDDEPVYDIDLDKSGPATIDANQQLTYTLDWKVNGDTAVTQAVITDQLPTKLKFVSANQGGTYNANAHTVTWNLGSKNSGDHGTVTVTASIDLPIVNGTELTNQACFDSAETAQTCDDAKTIAKSAPILEITKSNSVTNFTNPGQVVTYTVTVSNASNATDSARNVVLTDVLPNGFTFVSSGGSTKNFNLGDLAPGVGVPTVYTVKIDEKQAAGVFTNTATATGSNTLPVSDTSNVEVRHPSVQSSATQPKLELTKSVNPTVATPGQNVTYTLVVKNTGTGDSSNVVITDTLPEGLSFVDSGGKTKVWTLAQDLEVGKSETIVYQVHVWSKIQPGTYTNLAVARADEVKPVSAEADLTVRAPRVLGLATTGPGLKDYLIFSLGFVALAAGYILARRQRQALRVIK